MVINKIKYKDVFYKWNYVTFNIHCLKDKNDPYNGTQMIKICTTCVKSPQHAEEVSVPLLKILYGGIIKVIRFPSSDSHYNLHCSNRIKNFYY